MATEKPLSLQVVRRFDATAERVFDAWLDPKTAGKWLFATATGQMIRVDIDARVGGSFNFTRRDGDDIEHVGEYIVIDRPRRLIFTFGVPKFSNEMTRVTVDIVPLESGCQLTLTHEDVPPDWVSRTEEGWVMILNALAKTLG